MADAQTVFKRRAIQSLVQSALHSPVIAIHVKKGLRGQLLGATAGDQVFDFWFCLRSTLSMQTTDLTGPGQTQLHRFNLSARQGAPFAPAAVVLQLDDLRGKRSP